MKIKGIIKACTDPKEWNGIMQIGFTLDGDPKKWYNVDGEEGVLTELKTAVLGKGNVIEFDFEKGKVGSINLISKGKQEEKGNWAEDMTNFEDLLDAAHKKGLISINTEMISVDFELKIAVFKATVIGWIDETNNGSFSGHGDAEGITNDNIKPHFMRMAETRAIARALRWYTNNAQVAEEETSGEKKD
jgi:hypothetical protein